MTKKLYLSQTSSFAVGNRFCNAFRSARIKAWFFGSNLSMNPLSCSSASADAPRTTFTADLIGPRLHVNATGRWHHIVQAPMGFATRARTEQYFFDAQRN